jgi:hypothetical protein
MKLTNIFINYKDQFLASHGHRLSKEQHYALDALTGCRSGMFGEVHLHWLPAGPILRSCNLVGIETAINVIITTP